MNWKEIKIDIESDLLQRNLVNPSIRINAISSVDELLKNLLERYSENPAEFCKLIGKNILKHLLETVHPNQKLNGAQESIVNEIYYRIDK